jgi:two-component system sensor histidine kinase PilS (NtrC family)
MHGDLVKRVRALILIRVVIVTILLGSFYLYKIGYEKLAHPTAFSSFVASLYLLTIFYALALRWLKRNSHYVFFAYTQIVIDIIAETILIHLTGGIESMFSFVYPLSILSAGIVLTRKACYITATLSSILYGVLLDLQAYNIINRPDTTIYSDKDFFYFIFAHVIVFYLVGYLSGYFSEKLRRATRTLEERDTILSDLKAFSEYVIESMPSGIFTTNLNRNIVSFNTAAQKITKRALAEAIGKFPEEIFPFLTNYRETFDRIEGEIRRKDETFPVGIRLSHLKDSAGRPIGLIGVFQDLTELKAMEQEVKRKEKWAFIGELSASIAHELRNPLASLKASVEMLREKKVSEEHAEQLMKIALSEMDRLNGIITEFLLYARPQQLNKQSFDLHKSLKDVVMLLQNSETKNENVNITATLNGSLMVTGDAKQMQQVFWNLGLNAIDAVSGGGKVDVYTNENRGAAEIIFSDTGKGIRGIDIDKIFYPFYTTKENGTGLGLSIAQKITEEHGGKILVESEGEGKGTAFKVVLPMNSA